MQNLRRRCLRQHAIESMPQRTAIGNVGPCTFKVRHCPTNVVRCGHHGERIRSVLDDEPSQLGADGKASCKHPARFTLLTRWLARPDPFRHIAGVGPTPCRL